MYLSDEARKLGMHVISQWTEHRKTLVNAHLENDARFIRLDEIMTALATKYKDPEKWQDQDMTPDIKEALALLKFLLEPDKRLKIIKGGLYEPPAKKPD